MTVRNDIVATLVADGGPRPVSELLRLGGRQKEAQGPHGRGGSGRTSARSGSGSGRRAPAFALVRDRAGDERRAARPLPDVPAPALQGGAADGRRRGRAAGLDANAAAAAAAAAAVGIPPRTPPRTPAEARRTAHSQADHDLS